MLMTQTIFHNVNAIKTKLDCQTYPYHAQEEIPPLEGLKNVGCSLEPCSDCNAMMWYHEMPKSRRSGPPHFNICCDYGRVRLDHLPTPLPLLDSLFNNRTFMKNIRTYNSIKSFTSIGASIDHSIMDGRGPYTFCISGENYHQIGSLLPPEGQLLRFTQLYIYDTKFESRNRLHTFGKFNSSAGVRLSTI